MSDFPHVPAAFINAIAEEGTKAEAVEALQQQWNENCVLRGKLAGAEAVCDSYATENHRFHDKIEDLTKQAVIAKKALLEIEQMGETAPLNTLACQLGNIAHAARIELRLTDDLVKP